jgi:hypothetical protein
VPTRRRTLQLLTVATFLVASHASHVTGRGGTSSALAAAGSTRQDPAVPNSSRQINTPAIVMTGRPPIGTDVVRMTGRTRIGTDAIQMTHLVAPILRTDPVQMTGRPPIGTDRVEVTGRPPIGTDHFQMTHSDALRTQKLVMTGTRP